MYSSPKALGLRFFAAIAVSLASIGAAVSEWADTGDDLLDRADRAMYQSKQLGGSRLTVAGRA